MSAYERSTLNGSVASIDTLSSPTDRQLGVALIAKQQSKTRYKRSRRQREKNGTKGDVIIEPSMDAYRNSKDNYDEIQMAIRGSIDKLMSLFSKKTGPKKEEDIELIQDALKERVLFSTFNDDTILSMALAMELRVEEKGKTIFKQGDDGEELFVVKSGHIILEKEPGTRNSGSSQGGRSTKASESKSIVESSVTEVSRYDSSVEQVPGDCFGELALVYSSPRQMSCRTLERTELWVLKSDAFRKINRSIEVSKQQMIEKALDKVPLLNGLNEDQKYELQSCVEMVKLKAHTNIVNKGALDDTFYMLVKGTAEVTDIGDNLGGEEPLTYHAGDYFGERALLEEAPRAANITATSDVELLAISSEEFHKHLGNLEQILEQNTQMKVLETAKIFANLDRQEKQELCKSFVVETFSENTTIIKQGEHGTKFYIIKSGVVSINSNVGVKEKADVTTLIAGDYFGEGSLLSNEPANANVVADGGEVKCYTIDRVSFDKLKSLKKEELVQKNIIRQRETFSKEKETTENILKDVNLKDLNIVCILGSGCFGLVKLVDIEKLHNSYALKVLEKGAIIKNHQQLNVHNEKNILMNCDHPFVVKLYRTFKDKKYLYLMMEYVQGGELFNFLHVVYDGHLPDHFVKFYTACVIDALHYLHSLSIVYRDLKPENLMIDNKGYIKMVDFGFAKKLVFKTFTVCGTAQYLAPEILVHRGYSKSVDYWTLGILIYEMVTGTTPFRNKDKDVLFDNILHKRTIRFGKNFSEGSKDLVMKLLHKRPRLRLGMSKGGAMDVKKHKFFAEMDFDKLVNKEIAAPWIPKIEDKLDYSNFDEYDMDDSPLTGKYDKYSNRNPEIWKDF